MTYFIDIDGTICTQEKDGNYANAKPYMNRIEKINKLYGEGNIIVYYTARGTTTGLDWKEITEKQFKDWGVKCNEIRYEKPYYDKWIDDKAINDKEFFDD